MAFNVRDQIMCNRFDLICAIGIDGNILQVSEAAVPILGYDSKELEGTSFITHVHPRDQKKTGQYLEQIENGKTPKDFLENCLLQRNGAPVNLIWSFSWLEEDQAHFGIGRKTAEQSQTHQQLRKQEELHKALMESGADMFALVDPQGGILHCGGAVFRTLGYGLEELLGRNVLSFVHPEDQPRILDIFRQLSEEENTSVIEFRCKTASGNWVWVETIGRNQLQNPYINALVLSSREITERIYHREQLQQREQQFRALFENNPDMILVEDRNGNILEANPTFLDTLHLSKEEVVNRHQSEFLPPEVAPVCEQKLREAFEGNKVSCEIELPGGSGQKVILHLSKIPIVVGEEVMAVYAVLRDVSEVALAQRTIQKQASELKNVFESITDAFFAVDKHWNFIFINDQFRQLLNLSPGGDQLGKNLWDVFPEDLGGQFYRQYQYAMATGTTVHFEAFLEKLGAWLEVKAYPSEEGLSVYFSDITEQIKSRQELEKLSLVASKTSNGVMIADAEGRAEWINQAFTNITGYELEEVVGEFPLELLKGPETDGHVLDQMLEKLKLAQPVSEEVLNYCKNGEKIWLNLDITPVLDENGQIAKFITIQTDVTFRKEIEASQIKMTQDLFHQNRDLQQFTYIVSHNLRAPVANALGLADLLTKVDKTSNVFEQALANLKKSVFKLDTILRDLSLVLSIRDKQEVLEKEPVSLADICEQAWQNFQESLSGCGGSMRFDIETGLSVKADRAYLFSIFYNLISNAIKYRSDHRPLQIEVKAYHIPEGKTIIFSDNGTGFDQAKAGNNVFKLYKRFHTNKQGRGIGLYLVKTQVEAMGGKIAVESKLNEGTRFIITLS
ncbi:PAS domain-containing sensor histidine kinase [Rufibacter ruber]|uniref:PAS domain-containing sensor histidine kinase n=1 Tax=Rufibacter ruber TaxID=1783499 RepID=UPI000945876A|nr:PAS domain-containing sensor histidine kinase [Rufibacter ruber]